MVLSTNDEKVVASKKHTQFKTRVQKPYPIYDQISHNRYPIFDQNGRKTLSVGAAHTCIAPIYGLLTKCKVKMAGYWPSSFLRVYGPRRRRGP